MYKMFQIGGKHYKIDLEKAANAAGFALCMALLVGAFVLCFGYCYNGFMR